jgi:O-antigen/teichoic acid export membrane protein
MSDLGEQNTGIAVAEILGDENPLAPFEATSKPQKSLLWRAIPLATKGGLAVLDQALISGSNFLVGILLARWLVPEEYGAYALAFAFFLLLSFVSQSLLFEPMAVFSGSAYRKSMRGYFRSVLWIHLAMTLITFVLLGTAAGVAFLRSEPNGLPGALLGVTFASPCILLFWLARRAYYTQLSPARAASGAFVYCVLLVAGLFLVHHRQHLSPFSAYVLMGVGALATAGYLLWHLRRILPGIEAGPRFADACRRHWDYGRWALASSFATWIPFYMYYPLLSTFSGMAQAGELRALMNLALPLEQTYTALSSLLLPWAARVQEREGISSASRLNRRLTALYTGGAILYWAVVIPLRVPAFHLLYGGKYLEVAYLIPLVGLETLLSSAAFGPATVLRAMESPASIFYARCSASVLSLAIGIPLTRSYGLAGVVWSIVLSNVAAFLVTLYLLHRKVAAGIEPVNAEAQTDPA